MISNDILENLKKEGAVKNKTSDSLSELKEEVKKILIADKLLEDSIAKLKEQITKGKQYKFKVNRDKDGFINEIIAESMEVK